MLQLSVVSPSRDCMIFDVMHVKRLLLEHLEAGRNAA
jgi:hypothetical protein